MGYLIYKKHNYEYIEELGNIDGYTFKPKFSDDSFLDVKKIIVVDKYMIDKILSIKFNKALKKIVKLAMKILEDEDATDDGVEIVLGEVELVRQILLNRYQNFLNHEKEKLFLQKLRLIENELRLKQKTIKERSFYLEQVEMINKGRRR